MRLKRGPRPLARFANRRASVLGLLAVTASLVAVFAANPVVAAASSGVSIGSLESKFYESPLFEGAFTATPSDTPLFEQTFPQVDFNPPEGTVPCTNSTGIGVESRPFTDVIQQADKSCTTIPAEGNGNQAGVGNLESFDAVFSSTITVAEAGTVEFGVFSDDGWIMGIGPGPGGAQPTYVSGALINAPSSTPFHGYEVVGSYNIPSSPTENEVSVNFPAAGTYPIELDYTECCGGQLSFTLQANGTAIPPVKAPTELATSLSGGAQSGEQITVKEGTPVTDHATLSGENASHAEGEATYKVYADAACEKEVASAGSGTVSGGVVPASEERTLPPGKYYWQASYSGDETNAGSKSPCGSEIETVESPAPACSKVSGTGHWGPRGTTGGNLDNNLSTSLTSKEELGTTTPNGAFQVHLTKLTSAKCIAIAGGHEFSGSGTANVNRKKGYVVSFAFEQTGGQTYYTLTIEKEAVVIYSLTHQQLNRPTSEHFA